MSEASDEARNHGSPAKRHKSIFDPAEDRDDAGDEANDPATVEIKSEPVESTSPSCKLSLQQKARAEKNRLKALTLRKARLMERPQQNVGDSSSRTVNIVTGESMANAGLRQEKKLIDSGAGFFIEEESTEDGEGGETLPVTELPAPIIRPDQPKCVDCGEEFSDSYLFRTFDFLACDSCRDTSKDGKHELITKTEAKNLFLLKDFDLDKREPALKFIVRKNPHNSRWGDMKLYLRSQIEDRALEVWGTEDALQAEWNKREQKREDGKVKKFNKKIKALRMQVRGSLFEKDIGGHEHEFGDEVYDEDNDEYSKTCKTCTFVQRYEKM